MADSAKFKLRSGMVPRGDQPAAIEKLTKSILSGPGANTLLGVTGSGKTFTMAHIIANLGRPTLVVSHNKTLAAQLYSELKELFPENAVEYFVSYYDYYQPEAYVPQTDTFIEKDSSINEEIDKLRLSATSSLMSRDDVIIVASVSCIYGLGSPEDYRDLLVFLEKDAAVSRDDVLKKLVDIQYTRNDLEFERGRFRVRGDVVDIFPAYRSTIYRVEFYGDRIERIREMDHVSGKCINEVERVGIYPAKHFVTTPERIKKAVGDIKLELQERLEYLRNHNKLLEAQRVEMRTNYDIEMLEELGYCSGVENYSRHLAGRAPGSRPSCLIDYFPKDLLTVIDESHVTVPQLRGMYWGDRSRKETLVNYGFRLPSALDNRPLQYNEFEALIRDVVYVSATPSDYEIGRSCVVAEQIIRPTGLLDPEISVRHTEGQVDDLIMEIKTRAKRKERVLVTTLTKRMAEDLSMYLSESGIRVRYLHSEIDALERVEILRDLRLRKFDCLVGINLLREGLDLPEVSLVAVLDADKEGFLRSQTSLIQVAGRAARNINGTVIMYADMVTESMKRAIDESRRRRKIQAEFNEKNNITPTTIKKAVREGVESYRKAKELINKVAAESEEEHEINTLVAELQRDMEVAARNLQFEKAIILRDQVAKLKREAKG
jgi:excinuclease ABC subunit B